MPLVSHFPLPTFGELRERGHQVLDLNQAHGQDIRELHIGLLNMMPNAAFQVTERQYLGLIGSCNQIVQFYVHPFTLPGLERDQATAAYIERYYRSFEEVQRSGLDALIITGANVTNPDLEKEAFWAPLREVADWAQQTVTSVMCSCLASHALIQMLYGVQRRAMDRKKWGVYRHFHTDAGKAHPLLRDVNTMFAVPHSRWNTLDLEDLQEAGVPVLVVTRQDDVHLATSPDGFRFIFSQGHPEYDINSLLKEYKREVLLYTNGQRSTYPPFPENYFSERCERLGRGIERQVRKLKAAGQPFPPEDFAETEFESCLHNTWGDTGKAIFNNWLGLVYQRTHLDRCKPFLDGVDPNDPLGLRTRGWPELTPSTR
jgi:homoserine O-succinyltransferase